MSSSLINLGFSLFIYLLKALPLGFCRAENGDSWPVSGREDLALAPLDRLGENTSH